MTGGSRSFGRLELARLYLSYQRYAFVMAALPIAIVLALVWRFPSRWYVWAPLALLSLQFEYMAFEIYRRFPRKLRATLAARRKIARGTFHPRFVRRFCGDPCYRLVAHEVLRAAGLPRAERHQLVRTFTQEKRNESDFVLFVDRTNGVQIRIEGSGVQNWPRPH